MSAAAMITRMLPMLFAAAGVLSVAPRPLTDPAAPAAATILVRAGVHDDMGVAVSGLTGDDFELLVNGQPRVIRSASADAGPLMLVLLLDISVSAMTDDPGGDVVPFLATITSLRSSDRIRVGYIARRAQLMPAFTGDRRELESEIRQLFRVRDDDRRGPSPIWDGAHDAIVALDGQTGHRAMILITDGRASGNRLSLRDVAVRALTSEVSVNVAGVAAGRMTMRQTAATAVNVTPARYLEWIAETTGGAYVTHQSVQGRLASMADRGRQADRLIALLRHTYALEFDATEEDGRTPQLEVRARQPGLTVRARRAFLNPASHK